MSSMTLAITSFLYDRTPSREFKTAAKATVDESDKKKSQTANSYKGGDMVVDLVDVLIRNGQVAICKDVVEKAG